MWEHCLCVPWFWDPIAAIPHVLHDASSVALKLPQHYKMSYLSTLLLWLINVILIPQSATYHVVPHESIKGSLLPNLMTDFCSFSAVSFASLSLSQSLPQPMSLSLCLSAYVSQSMSLSLCLLVYVSQSNVSQSMSLSLSQSLSQSMSLSLSQSLSVSPSQSLSLSLSLFFSPSLSLSLSQSLSFFFVSLSLSLSLSVSLSFSLCLSFLFSLSISLGVSLSLSISLSLSLSLSCCALGLALAIRCPVRESLSPFPLLQLLAQQTCFEQNIESSEAKCTFLKISPQLPFRSPCATDTLRHMHGKHSHFSTF